MPSSTRASIALAVALLLTLTGANLLAQSQTENATGQTVNNSVEWIAPGNIVGAPDDNCAATSDVPMTSWIQMTFPAFTIPAGESVTGIEARTKYRTFGSNTAQLTIGGSLTGATRTIPQQTAGQSNCASTAFVSSGGDGDLWGVAEADLRSAAAAGTLGFRITQNNGPTMDIDAVELIVFFTEPNQPPVAVCQNVSKAADGMCQASVSASEVDGGSSDPDGDALTLSLSPSGPFQLGDTAVTLTVTDPDNASDSCMATVSVTDETAPVISLVGGDLTLECGVDTFSDPGFSASDNCDMDVPVVVGGDTVDVNTPGTYVITYDATDDSGNAATQKTRTVTVEDTIAPVITLNGDAEITLECAVDTFTDPGATASDACDDDVAVVVGGDTVDVNTPGTYVITYDATDDSGNAATQVTRTVIVEDTIPPEIQCNAPDEIIPPDAPISFTATADDLCDGPLAATVTDFTCFFVNPAGKPVDKAESCVVSFSGSTITIEDSGGVKDTIEWTVTASDSSGNVATETCSVLVVNPKEFKFAHIAGGKGLASELVLQNPSPRETVRGWIEFHDSRGGPLEMRIAGKIASRIDFSVPALGGLRLPAEELGDLQAGSATVYSTGPLSSHVRFTMPGLGNAMVPGAEPVSEAMVSVRRNQRLNTGAAILNAEDREIEVSLSLRGGQGEEVENGAALFRLAAGARLSLFLDEIFPEADTEDFSGELVIRSADGAFAAAALEVGQAAGEFTALPVTQLKVDQ